MMVGARAGNLSTRAVAAFAAVVVALVTLALAVRREPGPGRWATPAVSAAASRRSPAADGAPERADRVRAFTWMARKAGARCEEVTSAVRQAPDSWVVTCDLAYVYEMRLDANGQPAQLRRLR